MTDLPEGVPEVLTWMSIFDQTDDDIVPPYAFAHFPFAAEPVGTWNEDGDLGRFIADLYDVRIGKLDADGTYEVTSSRAQAPDFFEQAHNQAFAMRSMFECDFGEDADAPAHRLEANLGAALKGFAAFDATSSAVLSESAFVSLPHILEGSTDLVCVLQLAALQFYKQATQVLRGFVEGQVVDLHLARHPEQHRRWRNGSYKLPSLRGEQGLLKKLERAGALDATLAARIEALYGEMNAFVHGAEPALINSGLFQADHTGHAFREDKFEIWSRHFVEASELGVRLLQAKSVLWARELKLQTDLCETCWEPTLGAGDRFDFGGREHVKRRCATCGREATIRTDTGARVYVTTVSFGSGDLVPQGAPSSDLPDP